MGILRQPCRLFQPIKTNSLTGGDAMVNRHLVIVDHQVVARDRSATCEQIVFKVFSIGGAWQNTPMYQFLAL